MTWETSSHCAGVNCAGLCWRRSSWSANNGACVEAASWSKATYSRPLTECVQAGHCACGGEVLFRDSKSQAEGKGPYLRLSHAEFSSFLASVKAGKYDFGLV
jgi:Domain of unknown function (DUF397)